MQQAIIQWVSKVLNQRVSGLQIIKNTNFIKKVLKVIDQQYFAKNQIHSIDQILRTVDHYYLNQLKINLTQQINNLKKTKDILTHWRIFLGMSLRNKNQNQFLRVLVNNLIDAKFLEILIPFIHSIQQLLDDNFIQIKNNQVSKEIYQLFEQIENLNEKNTKLQEKVTLLQNEIDQRQEQYDIKKKQLQKKIKELNEQKYQVLAQYEGLYGQNRLILIFKEMEKQCLILNQSLRQKQDMIKYFQEQFEQMKNQNQLLKQDNKNIEKYNQEIQKYQEKIKQQQSWISQLKQKQLQLNNQIIQLNEAKANYNRGTIGSFRGTIGAYRETMGTFTRDTVPEFNNYRDTINNQLSVISENFGQQNQINDDNNINNNSARNIYTNVSSIDQKDSQLFSSERKILPIERMPSKLRLSKKLSLQKQLKPLINEENVFVKLRKNLFQINMLENQLKQKKQQIENKQSIIKDKEITIQEQRIKITTLEKLIESLKKQIDEKQQLQITMQDEYETKFINLCEQIQQLKEYFSKRNEQISNLQKRNSQKSNKLKQQYEYRVDSILMSLQQQLLNFSQKQLDHLQQIRKLKLKIQDLNQKQKQQNKSLLLKQSIKLQESLNETTQTKLNLDSVINKNDNSTTNIQNGVFEYASEQNEQRRKKEQVMKEQLFEMKQNQINMQNEFSQKKQQIIKSYLEREQKFLKQIEILQGRNKLLENQLNKQKSHFVKYLENYLSQLKSKQPEYINKIQELNNDIQNKNNQIGNLQLKKSKINSIYEQIKQFKKKQEKYFEVINDLQKKSYQIERKKINAKHQIQILQIAENRQNSQLINISQLNQLHELQNQYIEELNRTKRQLQKVQKKLSQKQQKISNLLKYVTNLQEENFKASKKDLDILNKDSKIEQLNLIIETLNNKIVQITINENLKQNNESAFQIKKLKDQIRKIELNQINYKENIRIIKQELEKKTNQNFQLLNNLKNSQLLNAKHNNQYMQALSTTNANLVEKLKNQAKCFYLFKKRYQQIHQKYQNIKDENELLISVITDLRINCK